MEEQDLMWIYAHLVHLKDSEHQARMTDRSNINTVGFSSSNTKEMLTEEATHILAIKINKVTVTISSDNRARITLLVAHTMYITNNNNNKTFFYYTLIFDAFIYVNAGLETR